MKEYKYTYGQGKYKYTYGQGKYKYTYGSAFNKSEQEEQEEPLWEKQEELKRKEEEHKRWSFLFDCCDT